ncbi:MAG: hypothetical protein LBO81_05900 [Clostridiales Family XIII bacterium]|jgi:lysylphosphatidylglycerol synthetase-like protein (DUF2156 family)|nr:hypothetical protein [Clostridiales Family XIII bacterium]
MKTIGNSIRSNPKKFFCSVVALALAVAGFVLYLTKGVIAGFTDEYSAAMIIFASGGILANVVFSVKRINTLEAIPAVAYIICIFLFLAVNANYMAAVIRKIDVFSFSNTFVATIVMFALAALVFLVGFTFKSKDCKSKDCKSKE